VTKFGKSTRDVSLDRRSGRLQVDWPSEARTSTLAQLLHNIAIELIEESVA
jgi:hypothetical protein